MSSTSDLLTVPFFDLLLKPERERERKRKKRKIQKKKNITVESVLVERDFSSYLLKNERDSRHLFNYFAFSSSFFSQSSVYFCTDTNYYNILLF